MKTILIYISLLVASSAKAQQVDSIYFHLYTDSLKKGVHNYINVDGRLPGGRWLPLTSREIQFASDAGTFDGNDLILPANFDREKVTIKATLKGSAATAREITIWIKKKPDDEILPSKNDVLNKSPKPRPRKNQ